MKLNTTLMMPPESAILQPSHVYLSDGSLIKPNGQFPVAVPLKSVCEMLNAGWYVVSPGATVIPPDSQ